MKSVKIILYFIFSFLLSGLGAQSIAPPSEFLGYELGSRFSPHHKVMNYLEYLDNNSSTVSLKKYGQTYEGRDLVVAFVSSEDNLKNIEIIRHNNLRRAGFEAGEVADNEIAVVWYSYNVHGNEANSTETSMKVIHELITNKKYKSWLDKMIIVIDPCLNPDGRDRYVNWYTQVANSTPNANIRTREHHERWPGNRTNHYLFDLNRDWAWQTQIESKQRMKLYHDWMPQVHVDFHEQFFNDKYYFAPASEPMHEQITDWQKEFQVTVGKNNAKYFDEKGWLYFTKERFDLLYPGYGDTYPTFSGAIGMTYEMAGHSTAGLAIEIENGDTLKLIDRISQHYTTSLATLETCFENRERLLDEFKKYFQIRDQGSYILKFSNKAMLQSLTELLANNKIAFASVPSTTTIKAVSFQTSHTTEISVSNQDLVIPLDQPKSILTKVLFEKNTKLTDTLTYDITAWSLPYAYGLEAYYTNVRIKTVEFKSEKQKTGNEDRIPYAYVVNWQSMKEARFLAAMHQQNLKIKYATQKFKIANENYNEGSLIITRIDNERKNKKPFEGIQELAIEYDVRIIPVYSGFALQTIDLGSDKIKYMKKPKIALISGDDISSYNFGEIWYYFENELNSPADIINKKQLSQIDLDEYDVLILASGRYEMYSNEDGFSHLDKWIKNGGKLVLFDYAISSFIGEEKFALKKMDDETNESKDKKAILYPYADNERENLKNYITGGIVRVKIDNTHPLAYGYGDHYYTLKTNGRSFKYLKDGWNVGYIPSKANKVAGFMGSQTEEVLEKKLVFGVEERGKGRVVYFADNPLFRSFWQNGKLFVANAIYFK